MNALFSAFRFPVSAFALLLFFSRCAVAAPVDLGSRVNIATSNIRSTLDRTSNRVTSTVDVTITNIGDRAIEKPIQAPVFFTAETGVLDGLLVADGEGGLGVAPFQTFFFDLSAAIPTATFAPQQNVKFTLRFTPAKGARLSFRVAPVGVVNADPIVNAGGPYSAQVGQEIAFDASASSDPEGGALTFAWNFGDGSALAPGAQPKHTFATSGAFEVALTVTDPKGAAKTVRLAVNIAPAEPFALARIRSLDGVGLPLGGVTVNEEKLGGAARTFPTNGATGFASLGDGADNYRWRFSKSGHLDVWRTAMLGNGQVAELPNPWLAKIADSVRLSPLADVPVTSPNISLVFPPGAFAQPTDVTLTELNTQSLPFPLPVGWSPLAQFHLGAASELALPASATIKLRGPLAANEQAAVVRYNATDLRWEVLALVAGSDSVITDVPASGWYAVVVADLGETAPPGAVAGQPLSASTSPTATDGASATGSVTPAVGIASLDATRVTANAHVDFTRATPLPSGVFFRTRISETYALNGGASARTPDYDTTLFAYERPGGLAAEFPLRPQLLFGPQDLVEASIHAEVLGAGAFSGGVLSPSGGTLSKDGVRVTTPVDGFTAPTAAELGAIAPATFGTQNGGAVVEKAFSLSVAQLASGKTLSFAFEPRAPNSFFVLALAVSDEQGPGFTPLERFTSNAAGLLTSAEPASGSRLPGATGPGDYVLVRVAGPQALVQGIARDASGQPAAGLAVRTDGQPWLVFSADDGSYATLGAAGAGLITVFDARDGNAGSTGINITNPAQPQIADVSTVPTGPRVASTDPLADALNVRTVAPIVVRFTEPINAASFGANGVRLRDTVANADVPTALSLDLANRVATLFPTNPLAEGTRHEIIVSSAIRDRQNLPIEGTLTFAFTTAPPDARPPGAQLVIFEPGAQNIPADVLAQLVGYTPGDKSKVVATGTAGTADPQVAVVLVNQSTGLTATVLSKVDGSFATFIDASAEDFVTATFVNANNTHISVPATRQLFDDGRVGLYHQGGILEAQSDGGPVQIQIQPEAIKSRNVFKIESLGLPELLAFLNNTLPQNAQLIGGLKLTIEGDQVEGESELSVPLDPSTLQMQPGTTPENGAFALSVARQVEGQTVYQVVDKMRYEEGRLFTNTAPFQGPLGNGIISPEGLAASFGGAPGAIASAAFSLILMPLFLGDKPITVTGQVAQLPESTVSGIEIAALGEIVLQFFTPFEVSAENLALSFGAAKPVPGALISYLDEGAAQTALPGRVDPGLVCAISDKTGCYNLVMPGFSGGGNLVGTHPRLGRTVAGISFPRLGVGTAGHLRKNIIFPTPDNEFFNTAPKLAIGHTPLYPPPGGTATVNLRVISETTPTIHNPVKEVFPLVPGVTVSPNDVTMATATTTNPAPHQTNWKADFTCSKAALVRLKFTVSSQDNSEASDITEVIEFGGLPPVADNDLEPADPDNDKEGPTVIGSYPLAGDTLAPGQPIIIEFNEPIDKAILTDNAAISFDTDLGTKPAVLLSPDQTTLTIIPGPLPTTDNITLTIGTSVKDLAGNQLDQHPSESGNQSYSLKLGVGQLSFTTIPNITAGGGVAIGGDHLFVLDRSGNGSLKVFKIGANQIFPPTEVPLPGFPRDLVYIPHYSFSPGLSGEMMPAPAVTRDLLVVVGGNLGAVTEQEKSTLAGGVPVFAFQKTREDTNITFIGQYLRVFDVTDANNPVRIAGPLITRRESAVTKIRWQPPNLVYLENGADSQFIGLIDLQELLIGFGLTSDQLAHVEDFLPEDGRPGDDLDGNGQYTDVGEFPSKVPLPKAHPTEYFGFKGAFEPTAGTTQRIEDFAFAGSLLGVTLTKGSPVVPGQMLPPQYRTVLAGSGELPPEVGALPYDDKARPKRVSILPSVNVKVGSVTQARAIALVSLSPDKDDVSKLSVIDISDPTMPVELRRIRFDQTLQLGLLQSAVVRADGLIALATTNDVVLLDPLLLAAANPADGVLHPAIRGILRGAGTSNISASEAQSGLRAIALAGRNQLIQPPPEFRFVFFPTAADVVKDPGDLKNHEEMRDKLLKEMQVVNNVRPARFRGGSGAVPSIDPPAAAAHFHVLVRAPGAAGPSIPIALELLNEAGHPVDNKGPGFPPVRAADPATLGTIRQTAIANVDAPIPKLNAFRLSEDENADEFNLYLSEPIAVVRERMSIADLMMLDTNFGKPRAILWSEQMIRASIDNSGASQSVIAAFASDTDGADRVLRPKASGVAFTLPGGYILGPNPPPMGGDFAIPGTFGLVDAASGEFRHSTIDIELPSRRMPIRFERTVNNQDTCHGGFGNGWDFFYNQRLIELKEDKFLPGNMSPSIVRKDMDSSVIAESKDVEFRDGSGRTIIFKKQDDVPQAFSADPLVTTLNWGLEDGTCYLPDKNEKGVFDLLFRFPSGEFVRLTPEGMQFWYQRNGRLSRIVDKFPKNYHVLEYNERGELRKIIDRSVDSDRFLEIGYFRGMGASDMIAMLDEMATNDAMIGKIARLRDYAGRDVTFEYSTKGFLDARHGIEITGAINGGFNGRATTRYIHDSATGAVTGVIAGNGANTGGGAGGGTALLSTTTATNADTGALVANGGTVVGSSPVTIGVPVQNSAAMAGSETSNSSVADGGASDIKFDDFRYPKEIKMTGPMAGTATTTPHFNDAGLLEKVIYPELNSVEYTYNLNNPILRARPNITHVKVLPGTRGGNTLNADFHYDERYNVMSGAQTDLNGKTNTYTVRSDGREIESIDFDGGGTQKFTYDDDTGQRMDETSPEGVKMSYGYETSTGFLMSVTRGSLTATMFSYGSDVAGKLGRPNTITPPRGAAWTNIQYDALLQMTASTRGGMQENHAYDENGNVSFMSRTLGGSHTYSENREYGQNNFLKKITVHGAEINGAAGDLETKFDPDPVFRVAKITYPGTDMKTREFTYDHLGHALSTKVGDYEEKFKRDLHGNLLEVRTNGELVRTMMYDGHDRKILTTNKTGTGPDETIEVQYFDGGQVMKTTAKTGGMTDYERTVTDVDGLGRELGDTTTGTNGNASRTMSYQASAQGLTTTVMGPRDNMTINTDDAGRRVGTKNGLADMTFKPDDNDNIEHIMSDEHGSVMFTQDFMFDELDHPMTHSDGVGMVATFTPRLDGLATSVKDGLSHSTSFDFSNLGEMISRTRPEQIAYTYQFDENRLPRAVLDGQMNGNHMDYDTTFRRTKTTYRSGALMENTMFDNRNQPTMGTIPGGSFTATFDFQMRPLTKTLNYGAGDGYQIKGMTYDSLGRMHSVSYGKGGDHDATFGYDKLGPMTSATYNEPGGPFGISATIYEDGTRKTTMYPSNTNVEDGRENSGRLNELKVDGTVIWNATQFEGAELPGDITRGALHEIDKYDARKRLLSRRFTKTNGGTLVEDMRFEYDLANNVTARQFLGRGGRGDVFEHDDANRLTRAEIGVRPNGGATVRNSAGLMGGSGLVAGLFARDYTYDGGGLDLLTSATSTNPSNLPLQAQPGNAPGPVVPEFMQSLGGHDSYLHATQLDNVSRGGTDPMGNVKSTTLVVRPEGAAEPAKITATDIKYNGLNQLTAITLTNGDTIEYEYQPAGLIHHKIVKQGGFTVADRAFVWDQGRLIEERDIANGSAVVGRYYYADNDWPVAADLKDPTTGQIRRVQYICDNVSSVVAVADNNTGDVLERVSYDAWGQPLIEATDTSAPHVAKIHADPNGDLLFQFSEPVLPSVSSASGTDIVTSAQSFAGLITITAGTTPVTGTVEYFEDAPGAPFGSVIRFRPNTSASGAANVQIAAAKVFDSWGNGNSAESMSIVLGAAGDVFVTAGASDTSPPRKARSVIGNPFLFQGQYFDYDAGLAYMRARFYDPYTGQFLQRDPNEYEDSVNLYAGLGNNPSIVRDPSGTNNKSSGADILALIEEELAKTPHATSKATKIAKPAETTATELAAEIAQRATKRARGKTPPVLFRGVHMETTAALEKQLARGVLETPAGKIGGKAGKEAYKEEFQRVLESVDETVWERFAAGTDLRATGIIPNTTFSLGELILASPEERVAMQHILTSKAAVSTTPVMEFAANWAVRNKLSKEEAFVIEIRGIEEAQSPISRVRGTHGSRPINPCEGNEHVFTESIRFQEAVLYKVDPVTHATTEVWRGGPGYKK